MKAKDIYKILTSSEEKKYKILKIKDYMKYQNKLIKKLNSDFHVSYYFKNGEIIAKHLDIRFSDKDIQRINKDIFFSSFMHFLSPNKNTDRLLDKYLKYLQSKKINLEDFEDYFDINKNILIKENFRKLSKEEDIKKKPDREIEIISVNNPSFKVLSYISKFNIVDFVKITFVKSDIIEDNKKNSFRILVDSKTYKHKRILDHEDNDKTVLVGPLVNFYREMNYNDFVNLKIIIRIKKNVNIFQKSDLLKFLEDNGLKFILNDEKIEFNSFMCDNYELFALMSK